MKWTFFNLFFSILFLQTSLTAQSWQVRSQIKGTQNETSSALIFTESGQQLIGGAFSGSIQYNDFSENAIGEDDIFLFNIDNNGDLEWSFYGGSIIDDELSAITRDQEGNIYICGTYWIEANFGNYQLINETGGKAIFLIKLAASGEIIWGKSIEGTGLKDVGDVGVDNQGEIFLVGYFSDQLFLDENNTLEAVGATDAFFTKWDTDGNLLWSNQGGALEDTRAEKLSVLPNGDVVSTGIFDGTMTIADTSIIAGANDWDVFTLRLSNDTGELNWLRRAGSVFDQLVNGFDTDEDGNIYLAGSLVGVMPFSEDISIESSTGNPDIFLAKYDQEGTALWAKVAGSNLTQDVMDLHVNEEEIAICGFSQGSFMWENFLFSIIGNLGGFAAGFDLNGNLDWGQVFTSNTSVFADQITHADDGTAILSGSFQNTLNIGNDVIAEDAFDIFTASRGTVNNNEEVLIEDVIQLFPNPTDGILNVQIQAKKWEIQIWDVTGKMLRSFRNETRIDLSFLDSGFYLVKVNSEEYLLTQKVLLK